ncbi:MAG: GIY-YIG nuclease family protein, partial [Ekhidna sp.]|nr:GIY-YIG nuclease family protein [Ekhidna sp.]
MNPAKSNIANRTLFCHDNLEVLRGINSACIDLIYLDPPFNKKKTFTAPIGSSAEGAEFSDIFREKDIKEDWLKDIKEDHYSIHELLSAVKNIEGKKSYNFCYLAYIAIRLMECHRVLKDTGSLYLHCDPTMSHYLKLVLDCVFGEENFQNEVIWGYNVGGKSKKRWARKHDVILFYGKKSDFYFDGIKAGIQRDTGTKSRGGKIGVDSEGKRYQDKIVRKTGKVYRYYLNEPKIPEDWWFGINSLQSGDTERTGYPTQKPLALLERIIKASSPQDGIVLDPFCGCATTCVASEKLNRQWIGIDVSVKAYELVKIRLEKEVKSLFAQNIGFYTSPPDRTDQGVDYLSEKYVYIISNPQYEGEYKVGIASNVKSRLNSYQTADPERSYKLEYAHL